MADNRACQYGMNSSCKKEAVCIDTNKIYDSCCDKDCLSDLRVYFTDSAQMVIENASSIRCRKAEIINCCVDVEPVPFNKGCYSVNITYFFKLVFDVFDSPCCTPTTVCGLTSFTKKCVLYGSEGCVKVFTSDFRENEVDEQFMPSKTNPRAKVQTVDPIVLDAKLCEVKECCECDCCSIMPRCVARCFDGSFGRQSETVAVKVTLGLFSIVQLERDSQILVPAAEFCIPKKECCYNSEDPCDSFKKIKFPLNEFFPPSQC